MPRTFKVRINLETLRAHLSSEQGIDVAKVAVTGFLESVGFRPEGDAWIVSEDNFGMVRATEILSSEVIDPA